MYSCTHTHAQTQIEGCPAVVFYPVFEIELRFNQSGVTAWIFLRGRLATFKAFEKGNSVWKLSYDYFSSEPSLQSANITNTSEQGIKNRVCDWKLWCIKIGIVA